MFYTNTQPTELETCISNFFALYKSEIFTQSRIAWSQEELRGETDRYHKISKYYLALYLVVLIYLEYKEGIETDWEYYKTKYKLKENSKCLSCYGISLDLILSKFGLPKKNSEDSGIEGMDIQGDFIIEPDAESTTEVIQTIDIEYLLDNPNKCFNFLNTYCVPISDEDLLLANILPPNTTPPVNMISGTIYFGESGLSSLTEPQVTALTSIVVSTITNQILNFGAGGYKYICIPLALGIPSGFIDLASQLNVAMELPVSLTVNGEVYNIYRTSNVLNGIINIKII